MSQQLICDSQFLKQRDVYQALSMETNNEELISCKQLYPCVCLVYGKSKLLQAFSLAEKLSGYFVTNYTTHTYTHAPSVTLYSSIAHTMICNRI